MWPMPWHLKHLMPAGSRPGDRLGFLPWPYGEGEGLHPLLSDSRLYGLGEFPRFFQEGISCFGGAPFVMAIKWRMLSICPAV